MEIWDLYDQDRNKLNQTMVRGDVIPKGCFHLVVESIIINRDKQVLIQKRHPEKKGYPGYWEFSCGGSATTGDTSLEAMKREIKEEIGIDLIEENVQDVLFNTFKQSHYDFYFITQDIDQADVIMQPEEVVDCKWVTFEEVMQLLKEEKFVPYHNYGRSHFTYLEGKINEDHN